MRELLINRIDQSAWICLKSKSIGICNNVVVEISVKIKTGNSLGLVKVNVVV